MALRRGLPRLQCETHSNNSVGIVLNVCCARPAGPNRTKRYSATGTVSDFATNAAPVPMPSPSNATISNAAFVPLHSSSSRGSCTPSRSNPWRIRTRCLARRTRFSFNGGMKNHGRSPGAISQHSQPAPVQVDKAERGTWLGVVVRERGGSPCQQPQQRAHGRVRFGTACHFRSSGRGPCTRSPSTWTPSNSASTSATRTTTPTSKFAACWSGISSSGSRAACTSAAPRSRRQRSWSR